MICKKFIKVIIQSLYCGIGASKVASVVTNLPANARDTRNVGSIPERGRSPGGRHGNPLHPGKLQSTGSHRVGHNWSDLAYMQSGAIMQKKKKKSLINNIIWNFTRTNIHCRKTSDIWWTIRWFQSPLTNKADTLTWRELLSSCHAMDSEIIFGVRYSCCWGRRS